ncbi:hypothetical protein BJ165DRAFT_387480 [Panaeolus papilionaceus]|nr:hypothetical protein BJ165DRAFT_387480 [Panaeolus papilionaceus]
MRRLWDLFSFNRLSEGRKLVDAMRFCRRSDILPSKSRPLSRMILHMATEASSRITYSMMPLIMVSTVFCIFLSYRRKAQYGHSFLTMLFGLDKGYWSWYLFIFVAQFESEALPLKWFLKFRGRVDNVKQGRASMVLSCDECGVSSEGGTCIGCDGCG